MPHLLPILIRARLAIEPKRAPFADEIAAYDKYMAEVKGLSEETRAIHRRALAFAMQALMSRGRFEPARMTGVALQSHVSTLLGTRSPLTVHRTVGAVRDFLRARALLLDLGALYPFARWMTPEAESRRYDARFFIAVAPRANTTRHVELLPRDVVPDSGDGLDVALVAGERRDEPPIRGEDLHAIILSVGDVDLAVLVHRYAARAIELADAFTRAAEASEPLPIGRELLDPVVAPVGHKYLAIRVKGDPPGNV